MDNISKAIQGLQSKEKEKIKNLLEKISRGDFSHIDITKLKGRDDIYRVRQGKIRIIFYRDGHTVKILTIERRTDTTCNFKT